MTRDGGDNPHVPGILGARPAAAPSPGTALRSLLAGPRALVLPGVADAGGALLVAGAGFDACYLTGAGMANLQLGVADVGLLTLPELAVQVRRVADATAMPVLVDGDTGHGGPLAVMRTVHLVESAGAAGLQIEDQESPKRCGHFDRMRVVPVEEMVAKIVSARRARQDDDFVIVARTDARAVLGPDAALARARAYRAAGADALFIEAPESTEELEYFGRVLAGVPLVANVVDGGRTPSLPAAALERMGYTLILHANLLSRVMAKAGLAALRQLRHDGGTENLRDQILTWQERQELYGLGRLDDLADDLRRQAACVLTPPPGDGDPPGRPD